MKLYYLIVCIFKRVENYFHQLLDPLDDCSTER